MITPVVLKPYGGAIGAKTARFCKAENRDIIRYIARIDMGNERESILISVSHIT